MKLKIRLSKFKTSASFSFAPNLNSAFQVYQGLFLVSLLLRLSPLPSITNDMPEERMGGGGEGAFLPMANLNLNYF